MKSPSLTRGATLLGALTVLHAPTAVAATGGSPTAVTGENTPLNLGGSTLRTHAASSGSSTIVRTIVGLLIVVAVIYGVTWILRHAKNGSGRRARGKGLQPLATMSLGSNRSLTLVRAGSEILLLGVSEQSVTKIRSYTEAEALAAGLDLSDVDSAPDPADLTPLHPNDRTGGRLIDALRRMTVRG